MDDPYCVCVLISRTLALFWTRAPGAWERSPRRASWIPSEAPSTRICKMRLACTVLQQFPPLLRPSLCTRGRACPYPRSFQCLGTFVETVQEREWGIVKGRWPCCCSIVIYCVTAVVIGVCEQGSQMEGKAQNRCLFPVNDDVVMIIKHSSSKPLP